MQKTTEVMFLEMLQMEKNEYGVYIFKSSNGNQSIELTAILQQYKEFLIEKIKK